MMGGCGGFAIWRWSGGRWKRWCNDDGSEVGDSGPSLRAPPSLSTTRWQYPTPVHRRVTGMGLRRSRRTPTTAPNPPHNTCPNQWCRGRCARETSQRHLNASGSQPRLAHLGAGGGGVKPVRRTGLAWKGHPTDTSGRTIPGGWDRITRRTRVAGSPLVGILIGSGRLRARSHSMVAVGEVGRRETASG